MFGQESCDKILNQRRFKKEVDASSFGFVELSNARVAVTLRRIIGFKEHTQYLIEINPEIF